jgi:peptide/nickel transport system substrate-binding protein
VIRQSSTPALFLTIALALGAAPAGAQKYGGTLQFLLPGAPASLSIHDEAPTTATLAMAPVYNNLVAFDALKPSESFDSIVAELAERWSWNGERTELSFKLRREVQWHDGKPFTSKDAKETFDTVRGASLRRLKLNPRKLWYANIAEIVTAGDYDVTFRLRRPQPSLLAMLSSTNSPVMPAHVPPAAWRTSATGTGPFVLKELQRDHMVRLERNPRYFVPGRPYLDGVQYNVIVARASQIAAYTAQQVHAGMFSVTTKPFMEALKRAAPGLEYPETATTTMAYILFNTRRPPFNNPALRRAISLALDRNALIKAVLQGGAVPGGTLLPPPAGAWGLPPERLAALPGYGGDMAKNRAEAQAIMRSLGYSPEKPLSADLLTSTITYFTDLAVWTASALKDVYIDAKVRPQEAGVLYGYLARRDFSILAYTANSAADDPDVTFYEHYGCGSMRNYSDYCSPEVEKLYDQQSQLFDKAKRLDLVHQIDERLVNEVARAPFGFRMNYNARWPFVMNFPPHQVGCNSHRMQEVWLDK